MQTAPLPNDITPRAPTQARGRERFESILEAAEALLLERGLSGFSIPELALRLDFSRTSIYHFFPTSYAILNELSSRYLVRLEDYLGEQVAQVAEHGWEHALVLISQAVMDFHNSHPVGRMLILGAPASDESYRALELTIEHLGRQVDVLMRRSGVTLPRDRPNACALTVELGTACLRLSYHLHGEIIPEYRDACANAMHGFLQPYVEKALKKA